MTIDELKKFVTTEINRVTGVEQVPIYNNPTAISHIIEAAQSYANSERKDEEITTLQWVLNQLTFTNAEIDQKYIEDRIAELPKPQEGGK